MNRPLQATLGTAAVASLIALAPFVAHATLSSSPAECSGPHSVVKQDRAAVNKDIKALAEASSLPAKTSQERHHKAEEVAAAKAKLKKAQSALSAAQSALTDCAVAAQPVPTTTTTVTTTATATATPNPLTFVQGTARLTENRSDLSSIPAVMYWDGVPISGTGFGSAWTEDPNHAGFFFGLTDRGPNVTAPDGSDKLEPMSGFQDQIGYFHLVAGDLELVKTIGLTLPNGQPMNGLVNTEADTGETILDQTGDVLPKSAGGLDTEGLVALPDGTFWVSDEYGPFIVHFDATGKELSRFDPYVTTAGTSPVFGDQTYPLPGELKKRKPNKGMEGLTVTPDGQYLVGIMQSSLDKNGSTGTKSASGAITRIVKVSLSNPADIHEYLYSLHIDAGNPLGEAVSEITALPGDDNHFIVDERDGNLEGLNGSAPKATKNLWKIDLTSATDVGPISPLIGTTISGGAVTYDSSSGLEVAGMTIEDIAAAKSSTDAVSAFTTAGISPASEALYLNYAGLVSAIDPTGMYFGHDKVEGVAVDAANPNIIYISNDSDFGITDLPAGADPTADKRAKGTDAEKFLPNGTTQDFGEVLEVDMTQVPATYKGP